MFFQRPDVLEFSRTAEAPARSDGILVAHFVKGFVHAEVPRCIEWGVTEEARPRPVSAIDLTMQFVVLFWLSFREGAEATDAAPHEIMWYRTCFLKNNEKILCYQGLGKSLQATLSIIN